jgi:hypothetical protein
MSPSRLSFVAQPRAIPKLVDFPVEIVSCGPATVVAMCARGHSDADLHSPLQAHQGGGGSPRTPIQSTSTPMWLGDLPYWKVRVSAVRQAKMLVILRPKWSNMRLTLTLLLGRRTAELQP